MENAEKERNRLVEEKGKGVLRNLKIAALKHSLKDC